MKPSETAHRLHSLVDFTTRKLSAISEEESLVTRGQGKWTRKQILGHLIDSSLNNIHRFIRARQEENFRFPDYDQPLWVKSSGYNDRSWSSLIQLWSNLNEHLAEIIERIPEDRLETRCTIGENKPVTLGFIVSDYSTHLNHHLEQILDPKGSG